MKISNKKALYWGIIANGLLLLIYLLPGGGGEEQLEAVTYLIICHGLSKFYF